MYTLTTALRADVSEDMQHRYKIGALAILECLLWTAATAVQFDNIAESNVLQVDVAVMLTLAAVCYVIRHTLVTQALAASSTPASSTYSLIERSPYGFRSSARRIKLKL